MIRALDERIDDDAYERIALADDDRHWELWDGVLVEKPGTSLEHNYTQVELIFQLRSQLDRSRFHIRANSTRVSRTRSYFIPDVPVVPIEAVRPQRGRPGRIETYSEPLPLVVEIWSPSTGRYDVDKKLPEYMGRGDLEIWRIHPFERRITVWRRQRDGTYVEVVFLGGRIDVQSLPGVSVDVDALFDES